METENGVENVQVEQSNDECMTEGTSQGNETKDVLEAEKEEKLEPTKGVESDSEEKDEEDDDERLEESKDDTASEDEDDTVLHPSEPDADTLRKFLADFKAIGTRPEETWDYTLKPKGVDTIPIGDLEFQSKLLEFDTYEICDHESVKVHCPCPGKNEFHVCRKCHRVFCCNRCAKSAKEKMTHPLNNQAVWASGGCSDSNLKASKKVDNNHNRRPSTSQRPKQHLRRDARKEMGTWPRGIQQHPPLNGPYYPGYYPPPNVIPWPFALQPQVMPPSPRYALPQSLYVKPMDVPQAPPYVGSSSGHDVPYPQQGHVHMGEASTKLTVQLGQNSPQDRQLDNGRVNKNYLSKPRAANLPTHRELTTTNIKHKQSETPALLSSYTNVQKQPPSGSPQMKPFRPVPVLERLRNVETSPLHIITRENDSHEELPAKGFQGRATDQVDSGRDRKVGYHIPASKPEYKSANHASRISSSTSRETLKEERGANYRAIGRGNLRRSVNSGFGVKSGNGDVQIKQDTDTISSDVSGKLTAELRSIISSKPTINSFVQLDSSMRNRASYAAKDKPTAPAGFRQESQNRVAPNASVTQNRIQGTSIRDGETSFTPAGRKETQGKASPPMPKTSTSLNALSNPPSATQLIVCGPFVVYEIPMRASFTSGNSLFDFHCWTGFGHQHNEDINKLLEVLLDKAEPLRSPRIGQFCIARYSNPSDCVDGWFRAKVTSRNDNDVEVYFIDFGNKERVNLSWLKTIPSPLMKPRPAAMRVSMGDFRSSVDESKLMAAFDEYIVNNTFRVTILEGQLQASQTDDGFLYKVRIEVEFPGGNWVQLAKILQNLGLGETESVEVPAHRQRKKECDAFPEFIDFDKEIPVVITHVNHLNDFYVIQEEQLALRDKLMNDIKDGTFDEYPIERGMQMNYMCLAKRKHQWARAKIVEISEKRGVMVRFIDFGDTADVEKLKTMPPSLSSIPQLVYRCSLPVFPTEGSWDLEDPAFSVLAEMKDGKAILIVYVLEDAVPIHIVDVYMKGVKGFSKSLLEMKPDLCSLEYEVDLDIRKSIRKANAHSAESKTEKGNKDEGSQDRPKKPIESTLTTQVTEIESPKRSASINPEFAKASQLVPAPLSQKPLKQSSKYEVINYEFYPSMHRAEKTMLTTNDMTNERAGGGRFTPPVRDLKPSSPLQNFVNSKFTILEALSFSLFTIRPKDLEDEMMDIQTTIIYDCIDSERRFDAYPPRGTLAVAKYKDGNYHRILVQKVMKSSAKAKFIDFGTQCILPVDDVKPGSPGLYKHQKLCYEVCIEGLEKDPGLLLYSDFKKALKKLKKMTLVMDKCVGDEEPYVVVLRHENDPSGESICKTILQHQQWEWEALLKAGCEQDKDVMAKSNYKEDPWNYIAAPPPLVVGSRLEGNVSYISRDGDVRIVDLQDPSVQRNMKVLQNQLIKFTKNVKRTSFFPKHQEVALVYLRDCPEFQKLSLYGIGKWNRCIMNLQDQCYRNLDYNELYPFESCREHMEVRRLPLEFLARVNIGALECTIKDYKLSEISYKELEHLLAPNTRKPIRFTISSFDNQDLTYSIIVDDFNPNT